MEGTVNIDMLSSVPPACTQYRHAIHVCGLLLALHIDMKGTLDIDMLSSTTNSPHSKHERKRQRKASHTTRTRKGGTRAN